MKLPFDLGIKLIFRLLIPGFLLTLGLYPILAKVKSYFGWQLNLEYLLIFSVILTGWLVVTLDQPIYMLLEGRRFWPQRLKTLFVWRERKRLERLFHTTQKFYHLDEMSYPIQSRGYKRLYQEASVKLRYFPLNNDGEAEARYPTRLGNLIDSYESYPHTRYGIDSIFYWYRLALKLDKDLREEIDTRQALADSSIYGCVSLFVSGLLWLFYGVTAFFGNSIFNTLAPGWMLAVSGAFILLSFLLYRAALYSQAQYGEFFKSIFDVFENRIDVRRAVDRVATMIDHPELNNDDRRTQLQTAWRYLHNYKVRCPRPECAFRAPMTPGEFKAHKQNWHAAPPGTPPAPPVNKEYIFAPYRSVLSSAYRWDRYLFAVKTVSSVVGVCLLLATPLYLSVGLLIAALIIAGAGLFIEIAIREQQKPHLVTLAKIEEQLDLPRIYLKIDRNYLKDLSVLFPQVAIIGLGIIAAVLWVAGRFPFN